MRPIAPRSHVRTIAALLAACAAGTAAVVALAPAASASPIIYPAALTDSFYTSPADLAGHRPGDVLAARPVSAPAGFLNTDAVQLKFRSTNSEGQPIAAVTTVLSPRGAAPGRSGCRITRIINALGLGCAPSTPMYTDDPKLAIREAPGLNVPITKGWSVAIPDHLGPPRAYRAAELGGQITLDGIRAARRFDALGLAASPVGMAGYSGGAMATAMAAAIAPTYARRTRPRRQRLRRAPMNIDKMAKALGQQKHPAFGLAMAAALGLEHQYLRPYTDHESAQ